MRGLRLYCGNVVHLCFVYECVHMILHRHISLVTVCTRSVCFLRVYPLLLLQNAESRKIPGCEAGTGTDRTRMSITGCVPHSLQAYLHLLLRIAISRFRPGVMKTLW